MKLSLLDKKKVPAPASDPMLEDDLEMSTIPSANPEAEAMLADLDDEMLMAEMKKRGFKVEPMEEAEEEHEMLEEEY